MLRAYRAKLATQPGELLASVYAEEGEEEKERERGLLPSTSTLPALVTNRGGYRVVGVEGMNCCGPSMVLSHPLNTRPHACYACWPHSTHAILTVNLSHTMQIHLYPPPPSAVPRMEASCGYFI